MSEVPTFVLDASVGLKWLLRLEDEPHLDHAQRIADDLEQDRIEVVVPPSFALELGHALVRAVRRERINGRQADQAFEAFLGWNLRVDRHGISELAQAWSFSRDLGVSF